MKLLTCVVCVIATAALAERPPQRAQASADAKTLLESLTPSAREALRKDGQVVLEQRDGNALRAVVRFERPLAQVYSVLTEPSTQASYLPHVTQSKTVVRSEEGESTDMVVSFLFTFRYRTQHWFYADAHRMEWSLDPAGPRDLTAQDGFWQLYALDEKTTIGEFGTHVAAESGFINFLRGLGERGGVAEALTSVRRHVHRATSR